MTNERLMQYEEFILKADGNIGHVRRDLHIAKLLAEKEHLAYDEDILTFAAYFHDISAYTPYAPEGQFDHALESGRIVPEIAAGFGFSDEDIGVIVEAVKYHDRQGLGTHAETRLLRNADGIDYLGFMAVARDFSKFSKDMRKAVAMLHKRLNLFAPLADLDSARELAAPR
ncbi:MAG: HD domain-containing protein, partial [Clostridia bacterium]|nr:HD domain-containing protein [Clostridia bacterium]